MKFTITLLVICTIYISSFSQAQYDDVKNHFNSSLYDQASYALTVIEVGNPSNSFSLNGKKLLSPASTLKTVTCLMALDILGSDFQYETKILYSGYIKNSVLHGNLIIQGSGDPSFGSDNFDKGKNLNETVDTILQLIRKAGITKINGQIVIDQSIISSGGIQPSWHWDDIGNYYATGSYGFNVHDNMYYIKFAPNNHSYRPTQIFEVTPQPNIEIANRVTTGIKGSGDQAYIYGHPYQSRVEIIGTIPPSSTPFTIKGANPSPSQFFKEYLSLYLISNNVFLQKMNISNLVDKQYYLGSVLSPVLSEQIKYALDKSNNMYTEAFLRTISTQLGGSGSTEDGISKILDHLNKQNVQSIGFKQIDGSGLSVFNRLSTDWLANFLLTLINKYSISIIKDHFKTMNIDYLNKDNDSFQVLFKSGSMKYVQAYCGIFEKRNKVYVYSFISNNHIKPNSHIRADFKKLTSILYSKI